MKNWPPAVWSVIFVLLGIGTLCLAFACKSNEKLLIAFIGQGTGLIGAGMLAFQHSASVPAGPMTPPSGQNQTALTEPEKQNQ